MGSIDFLKRSGRNPTILYNNSVCELIDFPNDIEDLIAQHLTYQDNEKENEKIRLFVALKKASRYGNLKYANALKIKIREIGDPKVCLLQNKRFPSGLIASVKNILKNQGVTYTIKDIRKKPEQYQTFRWDNRPPTLRPYQEEMLKLAEINERGVFEAAVGSGKTRVMSQIIKEKEVNVLVIVPSLALLEQIYRTFSTCFGGKNVQIIKSGTIKSTSKLKPIRIANVQTLAALKKKDKLCKVLEDLDMIMVDEVHHAGASTYSDLLPDINHIYYRYGFSGTFLRNDSKTMELHGFLSNVLYNYPPSKATKEGYLTPVEMIIHTVQGRGSNEYQREYDSNYCNNKLLLVKILEILQNISDKDQVLILVDRKDKTGKIIYEYLNKEDINSVYISGDTKKEDISNAIEKFNEKQIRILIGTSVVGEGVDVYSTVHLINVAGGKSEIKFVQAVGRCVRLAEGKPKSYVHDFYFSGTRYLEKHLRERIEIFQRNFAGQIKNE